MKVMTACKIAFLLVIVLVGGSAKAMRKQTRGGGRRTGDFVVTQDYMRENWPAFVTADDEAQALVFFEGVQDVLRKFEIFCRTEPIEDGNRDLSDNEDRMRKYCFSGNDSRQGTLLANDMRVPFAVLFAFLVNNEVLPIAIDSYVHGSVEKLFCRLFGVHEPEKKLGITSVQKISNRACDSLDGIFPEPRDGGSRFSRLTDLFKKLAASHVWLRTHVDQGALSFLEAFKLHIKNLAVELVRKALMWESRGVFYRRPAEVATLDNMAKRLLAAMVLVKLCREYCRDKTDAFIKALCQSWGLDVISFLSVSKSKKRLRIDSSKEVIAEVKRQGIEVIANDVDDDGFEFLDVEGGEPVDYLEQAVVKYVDEIIALAETNEENGCFRYVLSERQN